MSDAFAQALALGFLLACACFFWTTGAEAHGHLRIRADAAFANVGVTPTDTSFDVAGALRDDAGRPISGAAVTLTATLAPGVVLDATSCSRGEPVSAAGTTAATHTDSFGLFCVRVPKSAPLDGAALHYAGDGFHGRTDGVVPRASGRRSVELAFEDRQLVASLDLPSVIVRVTTRVVDHIGGGDPLRLVLFHRPDAAEAAETEVSATDAEPGGIAKFDVESRTLGAPGTGRLVVRFGGSASFAPAEDWALFQRQASVHLSLATNLVPADPSDGVEIPLGVGWVSGAVPGGLVEATLDGQSVGFAQVSAGAARVVATFAPPRGRPAELSLRYVPSSPGYLPGKTLDVVIPLKPPSPWSGALWLSSAIAVAYWVVRAWRRPARLAGTRPTLPDTARGRPAVELIERDVSEAGWRGHVLDAHDGTPIAGARISLIVPVFDGEGVAATHTTLADGAFAIAHVEAAKNEGARLVVSAPHHSALEKPAPPDGVLSISLLSRRRALLDGLVAWTKRAGRPFARKQEPTPAEVVSLARGARRGDVLDWARAIEEAAYGPVPPDERSEGEITSKEPSVGHEDGGRDER